MKQLKLYAKKLLSLFPSRLPIGMTEFEKFCNDIVELAGPVADKDSMIWVISSTMINLGPQRSHVAKNHFVRTLIKAAASQVAGQAFQDIKLRQQEAAAAKQAEAIKAEETAKTSNDKATPSDDKTQEEIRQ